MYKQKEKTRNLDAIRIDVSVSFSCIKDMCFARGGMFSSVTDRLFISISHRLSTRPIRLIGVFCRLWSFSFRCLNSSCLYLVIREVSFGVKGKEAKRKEDDSLFVPVYGRDGIIRVSGI